MHHRAEGAQWRPFRIPGFISRDTAIRDNTQDVAGVHVVRRGEGAVPRVRHHGDILFTIIMKGKMRLEAGGEAPVDLVPGDAFVIPPGMALRHAEPSAEIELLDLARHADFRTEVLNG